MFKHASLNPSSSQICEVANGAPNRSLVREFHSCLQLKRALKWYNRHLNDEMENGKPDAMIKLQKALISLINMSTGRFEVKATNLEQFAFLYAL